MRSAALSMSKRVTGGGSRPGDRRAIGVDPTTATGATRSARTPRPPPWPGGGVPVHEAMNDAGRILYGSISQARPRYFAFIGSSGLEIGVIGDAIAAAYDINLAVDARAATMIERQGGGRGGGVGRVP